MLQKISLTQSLIRYMNKVLLICCLSFFAKISFSQELNARVTINSSSIPTTVNKNVFQTLQTSITNFINNRKWTADNFLPNEKIECSFLFNLQPGSEDNVYNSSLTIQSARPIFNSSYLSPIINYQDKDVTFKYVQYQQLEFNENNVSGSDAMISNLTAVLAYYCNMILAYDYDSYSNKGGSIYFQKAQNIVVNAPDGRGISGWKAFDGIRNRYWLAENMLNSRYSVLHDIYFNYYRSGMDRMYEDMPAARKEMLNVLNLLNNYNTDNPNTMGNQFFFQGKANEWVKMFSKAPDQEKAQASELLQKLDITNAARYKDELK
jgi:HD superfamily phosphohydrolase